MPSSDKTTVRINRFCSVMGLSIAMLPVLLYHYYQYPLYAILLNQLVIPFAGILLVSPAVALVLSLFAPAFGCLLYTSYISEGCVRRLSVIQVNRNMYLQNGEWDITIRHDSKTGS